MSDNNKGQKSEASRSADEQPFEQELTEEDLDLVDGGDGGQNTYPPYL
ncbi:hypothetical protein [Streptomyces fagopyri]